MACLYQSGTRIVVQYSPFGQIIEVRRSGGCRRFYRDNLKGENSASFCAVPLELRRTEKGVSEKNGKAWGPPSK